MLQNNIKISVDAIIYDNNHNILFVKRNYEPYKDYFCLPGGLVEKEERLHKAITREVKEETGMDIKFSKRDYFTYFDEINRDPRFRNITHVFVKHIPSLKKQPYERFDRKEIKSVEIFNYSNLPPKIGFDHKKIIKEFFKQ